MAKKPSKKELLVELEKLREVSAKNEQLTKEFTETRTKLETLQLQMDECAKEQNRIVDFFIKLSDDKETIDEFNKTIKTIETLTDKLENQTDEKEAERIKEELLKKIEYWINILEKIVTGVIEKAKD